VLRPAGRLVLIGYTGERTPVDVPAVVMRELVVRGSVGATLADAREVVRLAAEGSLRATVSATLPLADAAEALKLLAADNVLGRVVLAPEHE
jgi:propanol-preferring alcohol dehydrogenase